MTPHVKFHAHDQCAYVDTLGPGVPVLCANDAQRGDKLCAGHRALLDDNIVDAEVIEICGAITRMGTPETPPEYCEVEVENEDDNCDLHGGVYPW